MEKTEKKYYDNVNHKDFYDVVVNIESLMKLKEGYEIGFTEEGSERYKAKKNTKCTVVGIVGNKNKGKSYILQKLSKIEIPVGHTITTKGISVNYPKDINSQSGVILIDTAGLETPLLRSEIGNEHSNNMSLIARDKQLTELFLQRFVISKSNVLIAVVGALTLADQKLLHRITKEWLKLKASKRLIVVHNLMNHIKLSQINSYIEEILLQSTTFTLVETENISFSQKEGEPKFKIFQENFKGKISPSETIIHLIMAQEGTEAGNYYNNKTLTYLQNQIEANTNVSTFSLIDEIKKYLVSASYNLFESPKLTEADIETNEKIIKLKGNTEIVLKRCLVDELGVSSLLSNTFSPKFRCYLQTSQNKVKEKEDKELIFEIDIHEKVRQLTANTTFSSDGANICIKGIKTKLATLTPDSFKPKNTQKEDSEEEKKKKRIEEEKRIKEEERKIEEEEKMLEEEEKKSIDIIHDSMEYGPFSLDITLPMDKYLVSNTFEVKRNAGKLLLVVFEILENSEEQEIDEI